MGRGSSGVGAQKATNARDIANMNEAQIKKEIKKAESQLASVQSRIKNATRESGEERALREAFPLGPGGLSRTEAQRQAGRLAERALSRSKRIEADIERRDSLKIRLDLLNRAKNDIAGTGKTQKILNDERKAREIKSVGSSMKWSTTNKGGYSNGGYTPKTIQSGDFKITGSSGRYTVFEKGQRIASASKLSEAKAIAERRKKDG